MKRYSRCRILSGALAQRRKQVSDLVVDLSRLVDRGPLPYWACLNAGPHGYSSLVQQKLEGIWRAEMTGTSLGSMSSALDGFRVSFSSP